MFDRSLPGFVVGVTAHRRSDEQVLMLERLGVDVMCAPTIRTLPFDDVTRLRSVTEAVVAEPPDYLIANTAVGMRAWFAMADSFGLTDELRLALRATRIAARGPKAAGSVAAVGFDVWWRAPAERLSDIAARLLEEPLVGRRVAVQLHGDDRQKLSGQLRAAGADVIDIPIYRWTLPEDVRPVERLVQAISSRSVDAVTFTAAPAVRNLFDIAGRTQQTKPLLAAFNDGVIAACVGPVCAEAAREMGITDPIHPSSWRLGSMLRLLADTMAERRRVFRLGSTELTLQGLVVIVDGDVIRLTDRERAVLHMLANVPGGTVTRRALLQTIWGDDSMDAHALESTIGRLRAKLGPAGEVIETAVRRGYRLNAVPARMPPVAATSRSAAGD